MLSACNQDHMMCGIMNTMVLLCDDISDTDRIVHHNKIYLTMTSWFDHVCRIVNCRLQNNFHIYFDFSCISKLTDSGQSYITCCSHGATRHILKINMINCNFDAALIRARLLLHVFCWWLREVATLFAIIVNENKFIFTIFPFSPYCRGMQICSLVVPFTLAFFVPDKLQHNKA